MAMTGGNAVLVHSGTPSGAPSPIRLYVYYKEASQSISNNTTTLSLGMYVTTPSGWDIGKWADFDGSYIGTADSGSNNNSFDGTIPNFTGTRWIVENQNFTVNHNADGSKTATIYWKWGVRSSWGGFRAPSGSFSVTLTKIPRAATLTSAPNFDDEDNPVIKYSNPAGNAVSKLEACISFDGSTDNIAYRDISKTGTSYTFNLTNEERKILRQGARNAKSRQVRFYLATTIDGQITRKYMAKTFTVVNANPTISNISIVDGNTATVALTGDSSKFIRYQSKPRITADFAAIKEAAIVTYSVNGDTKTVNVAETSYLSSGKVVANDGKYQFNITDSRGNKASRTVTVDMVNYVNLTCNMKLEAPTTSGDLNFEISGNYFNGSFGAADNTLTVQYRYKANDGSYGAWTTAAASLSGNTYKAQVNLTGLDYQSTYTFQARANDKLSSKQTKEQRVKTTPVFDWSINDFQFNVPVSFNSGAAMPNKVIWSGSYYMTENQVANLTDTVSNQFSGIILVFSRYDIDNSEVLNEHFCYHFMPKQMIALHNGKGSVFNMNTSNETFAASKYLYIYDDRIEGHANNDAIGTGNTGVSYNNNRFVLRYVIGV